MLIEALVFCIYKSTPKVRSHFFVLYWSTVFIEVFSYQFAICTINLRCLTCLRIINSREIARTLTEKPKEIDIYCSKIEEQHYYQRNKTNKGFCIPGTSSVERLVPRPESAHLCCTPTAKAFNLLIHTYAKLANYTYKSNNNNDNYSELSIYFMISSILSGENQRIFSSFLNQVSCLRIYRREFDCI